MNYSFNNVILGWGTLVIFIAPVNLMESHSLQMFLGDKVNRDQLQNTCQHKMDDKLIGIKHVTAT